MYGSSLSAAAVTSPKGATAPSLEAAMKKAISKLALVGATLVILASTQAQATAAEVKSIAVLVPEQGTDFGWNQQGIDAGRAVAKKYNLEFIPVEGLGYGDIRPTLRELAGD